MFYVIEVTIQIQRKKKIFVPAGLRQTEKIRVLKIQKPFKILFQIQPISCKITEGTDF